MHEVRFSIPERELGKADIQFVVKKRVKCLELSGFLKALLYGFQKICRAGTKIAWAEFDAIMKTKVRKEKR